MTPYPMTEVIAEREFAFAKRGNPVKVVALIGRPAKMPDAAHDDWYCPWRIDGPDGRREMFGGGVDAVQALLMAISGMRADLEVIATSGRLTFLGDQDLQMELVGGNG